LKVVGMKKKITKATFKSFIRQNRENLHIMEISRYDGMIDGIQINDNPKFQKAFDSPYPHENNLGIEGIWLTPSGNRFFMYDKDGWIGIEVHNCCRNFVVAVPA